MNKGLVISVLVIFLLLVGCAGPDISNTVKKEKQDTPNIVNESEDSPEEAPVDLSENKFIITTGTKDAKVKAVFEGKIEEFTVDSSDLDIIMFELKERYDVSLSYVRDHTEIGGLSYFEYKQQLEQKTQEKTGEVKPKRIQVELLTSSGKSSVETLFDSGNVDTFTLNSIDKDSINFDLADKYDIPLDDIKRLVKYYNEGEEKPDINELAEKVNAGLQKYLVEKDAGALRSVGCDFFNHVITFQFMLEGDKNAILYSDIVGPYTEKRVIRFKLNSQNLPNLVGSIEGSAATVEFETNILYSCVNEGKGVYWKGEDDRYADQPDVLAIQMVGGSD